MSLNRVKLVSSDSQRFPLFLKYGSGFSVNHFICRLLIIGAFRVISWNTVDMELHLVKNDLYQDPCFSRHLFFSLKSA